MDVWFQLWMLSVAWDRYHSGLGALVLNSLWLLGAIREAQHLSQSLAIISLWLIGAIREAQQLSQSFS